ncbi:hypothetical protein AGABI1DRAFT_108281 [Agaricus bisporus var. burnettii JB137-S8]|uniref:Protein kinase domain-containing protein n=1 Tax=Agaricus bisporus var. burnettii (strain JB137-S8 / ATCC MYA-4627 / FGSC 10392) TaxID=597362 RepID=K5WP99_AGABU|nr:uncharacterized protein AGABI1DRAFT_108281 [Agaricus bisporus var. burnettii JB137-S8]EKM77131.1 hypothetical protein AGABI1DRAFT_108281 [Agaricus bisporus var. burnettii JB137-S8]
MNYSQGETVKRKSCKTSTQKALPPMLAGSSLVYEVSYRPIGYGGYLLGNDSNVECTRTGEEGGTPLVKTFVRVTEHMGIVHRDIKPHNILRSLKDPTRVVLIDFGLTGPVLSEPQQYRNVKKVWMCGTADWASIDAHHGLDLAPRDDLESLAYTACFVLNDGLPWLTAASVRESDRNKRVRVCNPKTSFSPPSFPVEFAELLAHARQLPFGKTPDYDIWHTRFENLANRLG